MAYSKSHPYTWLCVGLNPTFNLIPGFCHKQWGNICTKSHIDDWYTRQVTLLRACMVIIFTTPSRMVKPSWNLRSGLTIVMSTTVGQETTVIFTKLWYRHFCSSGQTQVKLSYILLTTHSPSFHTEYKYRATGGETVVQFNVHRHYHFTMLLHMSRNLLLVTQCVCHKKNWLWTWVTS